MNKGDLSRKLDQKVIDYIDGHIAQDGIFIPVVKKKEIKMSNTKRFHNCLHILLGLNKCQRLLMDWLAEEMDDDNMIISDEHMRSKFIKFIESIQVEGEILSYKDQTVANAFHDLVSRNDVLIKFSKGRYRLNPEFYWRGSDKERIEAIMMNLQFNSASTNFKIIKQADEYVTVKKSMLKK